MIHNLVRHNFGLILEMKKLVHKCIVLLRFVVLSVSARLLPRALKEERGSSVPADVSRLHWRGSTERGGIVHVSMSFSPIKKYTYEKLSTQCEVRGPVCAFSESFSPSVQLRSAPLDLGRPKRARRAVLLFISPLVLLIHDYEPQLG